MASYNQPVVPALYFEHHKGLLACHPNKIDDATSMTPTSATPELPSEILSLCLAAYANWGDLAKLACVQKSWSDIVVDTANQSLSSKWELAQALLEGACGLEASPEKAVRYLKDLANVEIDESTGKPVTPSSSLLQVEEIDYACFPPAMKKIAECYLEGVGVEKNADVAVGWLEAAFMYGRDADAAHEMALIYEYGRHSIEVDVVAAAVWFEKAANQGNVDAMTELGLCYELGCGVEQSDEKALDWYTKAANLGHPTAKFSVGEIFEEARGVPQSDEEACLWYYKAALAGDEDSKVALRRLYDIARIVVPGVGEILNV